MAGIGPIWAIRPADRTADMPVVLLKLMVSSAIDKFCVPQIIVWAIALCIIKVFFPFVVRYMSTTNIIWIILYVVY